MMRVFFLIILLLSPISLMANTQYPSLGGAVALTADGSELPLDPGIEFGGGILTSPNSTTFFAETYLSPEQAITVEGIIKVPPTHSHFGKTVDVFAVGFYSPLTNTCSGKLEDGHYYMLGTTPVDNFDQTDSTWYDPWFQRSLRSRTFEEWNGSLEVLVPFATGVKLTDSTLVTVMNNSKLPAGVEGYLCFEFGYRFTDDTGRYSWVVNDKDIQTTFINYASKESRRHEVTLGGLTGSLIEIFEISNLSTPIFTTLADENGYFGVDNNLSAYPESSVFLIKVAGGYYTDANYDGLTDAHPFVNQSTIYTLSTAGQLNSGTVNVSVLSDIAWQYTKNLVGDAADDTLLIRLTDISRELISSDLNADGFIDYKDLNSVNPKDPTLEEKLKFNYFAFAYSDDEANTIIGTYYQNLPEKRDELLETVFGSRLSLYPAKDSRVNHVKVEVLPFGKGSFTSDKGIINYDYDRGSNGNQLSDFYVKGNSTLNITASPKPDTEIASWDGCDDVSPDLSHCEISLNADRQVTVTFAYKETKIVENFIDLTSAAVEFLDESRLKVTINPTNTVLLKKLQIVPGGYPDYYITGDEGGGFLRKTVSIKQLSNYEFELDTVEAALEEVVQQGTGLFSKTMTNGDVDVRSLKRRSVRSSGIKTSNTPLGNPVSGEEIPFGNFDGVYFIPSDNPNDKTFTIRFGDSAPDTHQGRQPRTSLEGTVVMDLVTVKGQVKAELSMDFGLSYDFGIFSGIDIQSFKFIPKLTLEENLELIVGGDIAKFEKSIHIGSLPFTKTVFFIGPVPVYITANMDFYLGADGKITAQISAGVKSTQDARFGFVYNEGVGFNTVKDFNLTTDFAKPTFTDELSGEVRGFFQPGVSFALYGISGPSFPLMGYLKLKGDIINLDENMWDDECPENTNISAWFGLDASFEWKPEIRASGSGTILSVMNTFISKFKADLKFTLFKKEWLLERWSIGNGYCNDDFCEKCDEAFNRDGIIFEGGHCATPLPNIVSTTSLQCCQDYGEKCDLSMMNF